MVAKSDNTAPEDDDNALSDEARRERELTEEIEAGWYIPSEPSDDGRGIAEGIIRRRAERKSRRHTNPDNP